MGNFGESLKKSVDNLIGNLNYRSTLILTPTTVTVGSGGGYEQNTEEDGTAQTLYCIPANYIKGRFVTMVAGRLKEGEVRFLIKGDEVIDSDGFDKVDYNGSIYRIIEIRPIPFNDVVCAISITCSRNLDTD